MTRVVNLHHEPYDVYIGRAGNGQDGYFGNPYRLGAHGTRKQVILMFKDYFYTRIYRDLEFRRRVLALKGKTLGCFCKPQDCHGDVIAAWLDLQPNRAEDEWGNSTDLEPPDFS